MRIYPAIDIKDGECVRLVQGNVDDKTVFSTDPENVAMRWQNLGGKFLHIVDLDGAFRGALKNYEIVKSILNRIGIPIQLGGGIREIDLIEELLFAGIARVTVGTRAIESVNWLETVTTRFPGRVVAGMDARGGLLTTHGWTRTTAISAVDYIREVRHLAIPAFVYTDVKKDGMLAGPNFDELAKVAELIPGRCIASGGISSIKDVLELKSMGIAGVIVGKALYTGNIDPRELFALDNDPPPYFV